MSKKTIILRHDVDNPLDYKVDGISRLGNRLVLKYPWTHSFFKNYNSSVENMLEIEKFYGAESTYFFRTSTLPSRKLVKEILAQGCRIGYHCDRDSSFQVFKEDLDKLNRCIGFHVKGVCKHGLAEVRSGGKFNHIKLAVYTNDAGLKYCCDGADVTSGKSLYPDVKNPLRVDGLIIFTNRTDLYRHTNEEVEKYIESHEYPLILVHPEDLTLGGWVAERFISLLKTYDCISVCEAVERLEKIV